MTDLHQYVPLQEYTVKQTIPVTTDSVNVQKTIMLGGDQLSKVRAVGAMKIKSNAETQATRLEGFLPIIEDWHTKLTLLEVKINFKVYSILDQFAGVVETYYESKVSM